MVDLREETDVSPTTDSALSFDLIFRDWIALPLFFLAKGHKLPGGVTFRRLERA